MGHALQEVNHLLKPGGKLLDLRPSGDPPSVEVHDDSGLVGHAGLLQHRTNFESDRQATAAVRKAVEHRLYSIEHESTFDFLYHAETLTAFKNWLAESWESAILPRDTEHNLKEIVHSAGETATIVVRRPLLVMLLKPM